MIDSAQNEAFADCTKTCSFIIMCGSTWLGAPGPQPPWAGPTALETCISHSLVSLILTFNPLTFVIWFSPQVSDIVLLKYSLLK